MWDEGHLSWRIGGGIRSANRQQLTESAPSSKPCSVGLGQVLLVGRDRIESAGCCFASWCFHLITFVCSSATSAWPGTASNE